VGLLVFWFLFSIVWVSVVSIVSVVFGFWVFFVLGIEIKFLVLVDSRLYNSVAIPASI
jgi:hypothetical protein